MEIPLLMAGALLDAEAYGLGNLLDLLPHFIIFLLCSQTNLLLPNRHGFRCRLADSNSNGLGPDTDL